MITARREIFEKLNRVFSTIPYTACKEDFAKLIASSKFIGEGSYGKVNFERLAPPYQTMAIVFKRSRFKTRHDIIKEIFLLSACNIMVLNGVCPNFPLTYKYGLCRQVSGDYFYFFQEPMSRLISSEKITNNDTFKSYFVQGIMAVAAIVNNLGIVHNDLTTNNIMVKDIVKTDIIYKFQDKNYLIPNVTKLLAFIDFGIAYRIGHRVYHASVDPSFEKINVGTHSAFLKVPDLIMDLVVFLKSLYTSTSDDTKDNELKDNKQYLKEIVDDSLLKVNKTVDIEYFNRIIGIMVDNMNPAIPDPSPETMKNYEIYTIVAPDIVKNNIALQLYETATNLSYHKYSIIEDLINYYTNESEDVKEINTALGQLKIDYPKIDFTEPSDGKSTKTGEVLFLTNSNEYVFATTSSGYVNMYDMKSKFINSEQPIKNPIVSCATIDNKEVITGTYMPDNDSNYYINIIGSYKEEDLRIVQIDHSYKVANIYTLDSGKVILSLYGPAGYTYEEYQFINKDTLRKCLREETALVKCSERHQEFKISDLLKDENQGFQTVNRVGNKVYFTMKYLSEDDMDNALEDEEIVNLGPNRLYLLSENKPVEANIRGENFKINEKYLIIENTEFRTITIAKVIDEKTFETLFTVPIVKYKRSKQTNIDLKGELFAINTREHEIAVYHIPTQRKIKTIETSTVWGPVLIVGNNIYYTTTYSRERDENGYKVYGGIGVQSIY